MLFQITTSLVWESRFTWLSLSPLLLDLNAIILSHLFQHSGPEGAIIPVMGGGNCLHFKSILMKPSLLHKHKILALNLNKKVPGVSDPVAVLCFHLMSVLLTSLPQFQYSIHLSSNSLLRSHSLAKCPVLWHLKHSTFVLSKPTEEECYICKLVDDAVEAFTSFSKTLRLLYMSSKTVIPAEKDVFLQTLKSIKPPDEYSSNISCCVQLNKRKLTGMKSYDCHMLMQEYLPIALRGILSDHVSTVLIELCDFFRRICLKDLDENDLQFLESRVVVTLCKLEKIFPPSFFTVMVHLVIHLVREVRLGGPIPFDWMYLIEREKSAAYEIDEKSLTQAHYYVLFNVDSITQFREDEGNELTNFLRTLVRMPQHIGIHYPEWRKVHKEKRIDLWSIVRSFRKNIKELIMSDMSTKWKCWKYELKKSSYDPTMTINEIVASQTDDRVETGQFRMLVESWFTKEKQVESERKKINRLKLIEPHVTGTKSLHGKGDIKAIGDSSSTDQEITNNSDWTNDDLSKVKGTERRGLVYDLSSIHDNMTGKNPSSASDVIGSGGFGMSDFFLVWPLPAVAYLHLADGDKSGVHDIPINISGVNHHHTSGNKLAVRDTLNKSGTSRFNTSEVRYRGRGYERGLEAEEKQVKIMEDRRDKVQAEYHATRDSYDALVCCVENTAEDRIMDFGASFHATYSKEELERFKIRTGKVRLADDKTLDIAGIGDVVLKTSFRTIWALKDLDEKGYHVDFRDQQWKVTKGSLVVAHRNKRGSLYTIENYLKEQTLYKLKVKIYSENDPTSGIRACVETLNKKNSIKKSCSTGDKTSATPLLLRLPNKTGANAKRNQERVKSILLLAIPDEYLLKFHNVADAKSLWEAIKSRFGGNEESKKMQKNVLKHQFENFSTASNESLDKAYDRFQKLISQLEVHGAPISKEDINQKFLRSLPPSWNQIALIMRNKPDIDEIDIDDLYNNLRVYEDEMKRSSSSTSTSQNLAFLSSENTSSTNEVSTASGDFGVSTAGGISQVSSTPCAHDVACSFFAQPTTSPQLENEDFQQIDEDDLEELDLRWQVAMLTVRCYNCHRKGHFARECRSGRNQGKRSYGDNGRSNAPTNESSSQALVAQDGLGGYDWSNDFEIEPVNYALMAISSSSSSSSSDDEGYELALESLESRILGHEKNELAWGEKYEVRKVVKERDELKLKIEKWEESSKNLDELLNSQMSARDKTGLGYGTQLNEMSNNSKTDSEISLSVFDVRSSDEESTPANDRSSKADGYHVVPPPITGNFLTPRADISFAGLDEYAIRKKIIESKTTDLNTKTSETVGNTNKVNVEKPKSVNESVVSTPNINKDKVIIEDWNSDDEDDVSEVSPVKTNETQIAKTQQEGLLSHNAMRTNHQNFSNSRRNFAPTAVLTKSGLVPISAARKNSSRTAATVSAARPIKTAAPKPFVNVAKSRPNAFPKSHLPSRRHFYQQTALKNRNNKVNTVNVNFVNTTKGKRVTSVVGEQEIDAVKSKGWVWRPKLKVLDHDSKNSGSYICKQFDYVDPTGRIKSVMAWVKELKVYLINKGYADLMKMLELRGGY
ncbi:ribonuclease H-like domain-containing protein [Tanacetum coccineum]